MSKDDIIIVTGLPRSGTSLMMQVLSALDIEVFCDNQRPPDKSNPKGYFEHQIVKNIENDSSWMEQVKGKAIKIISPLLIYLPLNFTYKIIFMNRNYDEIIKSQEKMLSENRKPESKIKPEDLKIIFDKNSAQAKKWIRNNTGIKSIEIMHSMLLKHPENEIMKIRNFLSIESNVKKAVLTVDTKLYRTKIY